MVRKRDELLTKKILDFLKKHPEGTYISEIARESGIAKSTVAYIINARLKDRIIEVKVGQKGLFRLIRLKQNL